jgi:hypothetical protein
MCCIILHSEMICCITVRSAKMCSFILHSAMICCITRVISKEMHTLVTLRK